MLKPLGSRWDWLSQGEAKGPWHPLRLAVLRAGLSLLLVDVPSWSPTYRHRDSLLAEGESDLLHLGSYSLFLRLADLGMVLEPSAPYCQSWLHTHPNGLHGHLAGPWGPLEKASKGTSESSPTSDYAPSQGFWDLLGPPFHIHVYTDANT